MIKRFLLSAFFLNFLLISLNANIPTESNVLCVDIGGTRIKAAILNPQITLENLKDVVTVDFPSSNWLTKSLPLLFDSSTHDNLQQMFKESFGQISFGITGPIRNGSLYLNIKRGIPVQLKQYCEEISGYPVFIENDVAVWGRGFIFWKKLIQSEIQYPCLAITLGTGIGVALMHNSTEMTLIEIALIDHPFIHLQQLSKEQPVKIEFGKKSPHHPIGRAFFKWIGEVYPDNDERTTQKIYNERITAFLKDMLEYLITDLNVNIRSIAIGGGNSRWVLSADLSNELMIPVEAVNPKYLSDYQVSSDIISLLGCLDTTEKSFPKMIPTYEELLNLFPDAFYFTNPSICYTKDLQTNL